MATAVHDARTATKAVEIGGRDGGVERVAHLAGGDAFAEADDAPVLRVPGNECAVLIRAGSGLTDVGHARRWGQVRPRREIQVGVGEEFHDVLGDGDARGEACRADAPDEHVALCLVQLDEVVGAVDRGAQPGV